MNPEPCAVVNGVPILDDFAEAFPMSGCRALVTADTAAWAETAVRHATGYGTSVIGCDAEAGFERRWQEDETPDGRPGASALFFAFNRAALAKAVANRIGQGVMTCPTTAVFDGLPAAEKRIKLGDTLRFFGDGWQMSKRLDGVRHWRVPTMDGEFLCAGELGAVTGVAGGNLLIFGRDRPAALAAAVASAAAMRAVPDVLLPFPGGVVRSGSKVGGRRYRKLRATTHEAYCPTLRGAVDSALPAEAHCAYEIVVDGLSLDAVVAATRRGVLAACLPGIVAITSGNYGGHLGKHHIRLREVLVS